MTGTWLCALGFAIAITAGGCDRKQSTPAKPAPSSSASAAALPANILLTAEPADAKTVEELKGQVGVGDTVAIRGRVGGSREPFVAGRAVFTIVGPGLKACSETPGDNCSTPWDYCCEPPKDIAAHLATVQVVDAAGATVKADVKGHGGIKELSDVIIVGKVAEADATSLVVSATGIYVAKP